jgi:hypothetical protein
MSSSIPIAHTVPTHSEPEKQPAQQPGLGRLWSEDTSVYPTHEVLQSSETSETTTLELKDAIAARQSRLHAPAPLTAQRPTCKPSTPRGYSEKAIGTRAREVVLEHSLGLWTFKLSHDGIPEGNIDLEVMGAYRSCAR